MTDETQAVAVVTTQPIMKPERIPTQSNIAVLDTAMFEQMFRVAKAMSTMSLVPQHLQGKESDCFLIVNQAVRFGFDPFAVAAATSVIGGRICYEGKMIHAAITMSLGIRLSATYEGEPETEGRRIIVSGKFIDEDEPRTITGKVKNWRTTRNGSPWTKPEDWDRMLMYRGTREWCRLHSPEVILGVVTADEYDRNMDAPAPEPLSAGNTDEQDPVVQQYRALQAAKTVESEAKPKRSKKVEKTPDGHVAVDDLKFGEPVAVTEIAVEAEVVTEVAEVAEMAQEASTEAADDPSADHPEERAERIETLGAVLGDALVGEAIEDGPQPETAIQASAPIADTHLENVVENDVSRSEFLIDEEMASDIAEVFGAQSDTEEDAESAMPEDHPLWAFWQVLGTYPEWSVVKSQLIAVCKGEYWKTLDVDQQGVIRGNVWRHAEKSPTKIDHMDEPTAFSCWIYCQTGVEGATFVEAEYADLKRGSIYQALAPASQASLDGMVKAWVSKQREEAL